MFIYVPCLVCGITQQFVVKLVECLWLNSSSNQILTVLLKAHTYSHRLLGQIRLTSLYGSLRYAAKLHTQYRAPVPLLISRSQPKDEP